MRNIFDQYSQPENRVTHALMTALNEDRNLLGRFLRDLVKHRPKTALSRLHVLEQRMPDSEELEERDLESPGIPDGWIYDDDGWCVVIESKVIAKLTSGQIRRHLSTARDREFPQPIVVAITPIVESGLPEGTVHLKWSDVYAWLRRDDTEWAKRAAEYLEIAEGRLIEAEQLKEGALTKFAGIPFDSDHPYNYFEGKRILGLALGELKANSKLVRGLGVNPEAPGRGAITGRRADAVWDFLTLAEADWEESFTAHPHLTLGIRAQETEATVTVPNAVNGAMRQRLVQLGEKGFLEVTAAILTNMQPLLVRCKGATPLFRGIQRRYPSMRSTPIIDAKIEFDLRTAIPGSGLPKAQPRWLSAAYGSFVKKGGANYQIQFGVQFRYDRCSELKRSDATELFAEAWLGCKPLVKLGHKVR